MSEIDGEMEDWGIDEKKFATALELGKIVAAETGLCCQELGRFVWGIYLILDDESDDAE